MKKELFILTAIFLSCSVFAKIPRTYLGLKIGETNHKECVSILKNAGFSIFDNDTIVVFTKDTIANNIPMKLGGAGFINDKLLYLIFGDTCLTDENCQLREQKFDALTDKYSRLKKDTANFLLKAIANRFDTIGSFEARTDDELSVIYKTTDKGRVLGIMDSQQLFIEMYTAFLKSYSDSINMVTSVGGCDFGVSSSEAIAHFNRRFGKTPSQKDTYSVMYHDVSFGGSYFDSFFLYFEYNKEKEIYEFVSINAQKSYEDYSFNREKARMSYESIKSKYDEKYTNGFSKSNFSDDIMELSIYGSRDDKDPDELQPIVVTLERGLSRGGEIRYYVIVNYYQDKRHKEYMDDI